jgi:histidine triad (HIT) family protein
MDESIFTKIIKGDIPSYKIYEDDHVIAILDINPLAPGHTLVIPKEQIDHLWDVDDERYKHLMDVSKDVANRQRAVLGPQRVAMQVLGNDVPHAHIHIIPLNTTMQELFNEFYSKENTQATERELAEMAAKLKF